MVMDRGQDFAAVMISLSHNLLSDKLVAYGIHEGELVFQRLAEHRRQHDIVNGAELDWNEVTKGVPQGTTTIHE